MITNPYEASNYTAEDEAVRSDAELLPEIEAHIARPAIAILALTLLNIVFNALVLSQELLYPDGAFLFRLGVPELTMQLSVHVAIAFAANQMRIVRSYRFAYAGATLCCIPYLSQFWILGIPLGIWAIQVLSEPSSKLAFQQQPT